MRDVIVDTSALLAYFAASEPDHAVVAKYIDVSADMLIVSPYVVAELDYLAATRHGVDAELAVLDELTSGAWDLPGLDIDDLKRARSIIAKYGEQNIGVADASNVVLAERYRTRTIVTLDRRHFEVLRPSAGGRFTMLPRDR
ncbi:MAG: PIN domain-containing protein [Jatrophihabitantaceae bacterium]